MVRFTLLMMGLLHAVMVSAICYGEETLAVVQKPTFWIVGQWTRILVQTPADCEPLEVDFPNQLELLGSWPHRAGDATQRFYFRAAAPVRDGQIRFRTARDSISLPIRVLSWHEVLTEKFTCEVAPGWSWTGTIELPRVFPLEGRDERKGGLSYLTPAELERQRADFRQNQSGLGDQLSSEVQDLARLYRSLPESTIPRAVYVNNSTFQPEGREPSRGCPQCGPKIFENRSPFYPWGLDRESHPWKVHCPECDCWFPSNDFANDDFTSGDFPDDGWGYLDAQGRPYSFVGYYVLQNYRGGERRIELFSRAYLATGDRQFARAATVLLFRVAEQYLNLALNLNQRERYTRDNLWRGGIAPQGTPPPSHSTWFAAGFYLDAIWSIGLEQSYAEAFERLCDYWAQEDPELIRFLQANHHPEIQSMQDVKDFIEIGYFRTVAQGCLDYSVQGNGASEQAMAMRLAQFLNTPRAIELVEWVFNNPKHGRRYYMTNSLFVDGAAYESPGYNNAHYGASLQLVDWLDRLAALRPEQYRAAKFPLPGEHPQFQAMFDHNVNMSLISRTYANFGDDGDLAGTDPLPLKPGASLSPQLWAGAVQRWPDHEHYARAAWDARAGQPVRELTDPGLRAKVTEIVRREGPFFDLPSQVLDGVGHVILRSGSGDDQRALWMRYGTAFGHGQHDGLTIGFEALQRTLLPEQGYFRGESYRTEWDMNWALHYCARITGASSSGEGPGSWGVQGRPGGSLERFADGGWAKMATASRRFYRPEPAPQLMALTHDLVQSRTVALVDVDARHSYAVSIFRVGGGTDHYLSFHGPRGAAHSRGLELTAQRTGTLAGPDVPYGIKWDSPWSKQNPHLMMFPFLVDVQRARPVQPWQVTWDLENQHDVHLRLHSLPPSGVQVSLAKGKPAGGGKPYELQWVFQHNSGAEPLNSAFIEVLEAYEGQPVITAVRPVEVHASGPGPASPMAFQIVIGDRIDTFVHSLAPEAKVTTANGIALTGALAICSEQDGQVRRILLVDGECVTVAGQEYRPEVPGWTGTIQSADYDNASVVATSAPANPGQLVGRHVRITNHLGNDRTQRITASRSVDGGIELRLEYDPRLAEGPVKEVHEDGIESAVRLPFGGLYYRGKTLVNEDASVSWKLNGIENSRAYIHTAADPVNRETLAAQFTDRDGDGTAQFTVVDYGVGDTLTVPTLFSLDLAGQPCDAAR